MGHLETMSSASLNALQGLLGCGRKIWPTCSAGYPRAKALPRITRPQPGHSWLWAKQRALSRSPVLFVASSLSTPWPLLNLGLGSHARYWVEPSREECPFPDHLRLPLQGWVAWSCHAHVDAPCGAVLKAGAVWVSSTVSLVNSAGSGPNSCWVKEWIRIFYFLEIFFFFLTWAILKVFYWIC